MRTSFLTRGSLVLLLVACGSAGNLPETGQAGSAVTTCVSGTDRARSLAVTDPVALQKFGFGRVMDQVRVSGNVAASQTSTDVFQTWMRTFKKGPGGCDDPKIDPNKYGLVCPRDAEGKLASVDPFAPNAKVTFLPVALFNRFDLAPQDGKNCGEYRIVYAMKSTDPNVGGRAFIIFEAALPNPTPAAGIDACLPVATFWQGLSSNPDAADRAAKLESFYFNGLPGFAPVVQAANYGLPNGRGAHTAGQVRTNFFVDGVRWHLREFKTLRTCTGAGADTCRLDLEHVAAKANPANELFAGDAARSAGFRTAFAAQVPALLATSVAAIGMSTADKFNEYESVSQVNFGQTGDVDYAILAGPEMRKSVQDALNAAGSSITVDQLLHRATTQTCGGCHQISQDPNHDLGGGLVVQPSRGFVQVDEDGILSDALKKQFLPARKAILEKFINDRCAGGNGVFVPVAGLTLGGSPEGSAN
ncbi:MAG: hypothetical protein HOO96_30255 [Polyangiaceae bacterium]|nr:hypothetical protein [Polyangiaceae bacterium]